MSTEPLRIAIIGAGVSGLSCAYYLAQGARETRQDIQIHIYERGTTVGGNAQTRVVSLGTPYDDEKLPGVDYFRWLDLGVNDINLATYDRVKDVMEKIGYYKEGHSDTMLPLENTECYFNFKSDLTFTDDADLKVGVSNPRTSLQQIQGGVLPALTAIINSLALRKVYKDGKPVSGEECLEITVGEFFDHLISDPLHAFHTVDNRLVEIDPDWKTPHGLQRLKSRVIFLRDHQFYPRISAMYFANDYGPEAMLLAAPFHYYCIQEGISAEHSDESKPPDRRYFVGGSQRWLEYFADYLRNEMENIQMTFDCAVNVRVDVDSVSIEHGDNSTNYDYAIVTTHADDAEKLLDFSGSDCGQSSPALREQESIVRRILASISYTNSVAVGHTYCGVLPSDRNAWRSYNVLIREGVTLKPYSMTYVCNRHQNDVQSKDYQRTGYPQFFVTLNPQQAIPDDYVLEQVADDEIPAALDHVVPQSTRTLAASSNRACDTEAKKCVVTFRHNLLDKSCFLAQRKVKNFNEADTRVLFAGGWTHGAGLHEECFEQAERVATCILHNA